MYSKKATYFYELNSLATKFDNKIMLKMIRIYKLTKENNKLPTDLRVSTWGSYPYVTDKGRRGVGRPI